MGLAFIVWRTIPHSSTHTSSSTFECDFMRSCHKDQSAHQIYIFFIVEDFDFRSRKKWCWLSHQTRVIKNLMEKCGCTRFVHNSRLNFFQLFVIFVCAEIQSKYSLFSVFQPFPSDDFITLCAFLHQRKPSKWSVAVIIKNEFPSQACCCCCYMCIIILFFLWRSLYIGCTVNGKNQNESRAADICVQNFSLVTN